METCKCCGQPLPEKPKWYQTNLCRNGLRFAVFGYRKDVEVMAARILRNLEGDGLHTYGELRITELRPVDLT